MNPRLPITSRLPIFIGALAVIFVLDQYTKYLVDSGLTLYETRVIIDGLFNLQYARNPGLAFGLFTDLDHPLRRPLVISSVLFTLSLVFYLFYTSRNPHRLFTFSLGLVTGGAIGNLADRLHNHEAVIDFLQFHLGSYYWPNFNIADAAITVGVVLLGIELLWREPKLELKNDGNTVSPDETGDNAETV